MRIAKKTHYGIQLIVYLTNQPDGWHPLTELAHELGMSLPFLKHIASALKRSRILKSQGGMHGGYQLARPLDELTVGMIFRSLGEPIRLQPCLTKQCNHRDCLTGRFWESVGANLEQAFDQTTLATVLEASRV